MLYRRKVLFRLISGCKEPVSLIKLHKLMFLFVNEANTHYYDFIPNKFGCYSLALHNDQVALRTTGMFFEEKGDSPFTSFITVNDRAVNVNWMTLKENDSRVMDCVLDVYASKNEEELIDITYRMNPFYGIRSSIIERFTSDSRFRKRFEVIAQRINDAPRGVYTIGYEGYSIDKFLQILICRNIRTLVDVRKNAFSMRREFCKTPLQEALKEVGIPAKNRKELLPVGKRVELFVWYQKHVLPECAFSARRIAELSGRENIALMCYEKDPKDCHRTLFAEYCKKQQPSIPVIIPIGGNCCVEEHSDNGPYVSDAFA